MSFPNHIRAAPLTNPDLVNTPGIHINAVPDAISRPLLPLLRVSVPGIRDGELAAQNDVRREAGVGVGGVVCRGISIG